MFFLLRMTFWLGLVCVLLSLGTKQPTDTTQVDAAQAVSAASAAVSDMRGFCDRQPDACAVGGQAAHVIGQRAQAGAKVIYEFISEKLQDSGRGNVRKLTASSGSQNTLTPADLAPTFHGGSPPLPRARPQREAQNSRPSA
ncbi:MAG TPA: DUF5330 domain-containing protein [Pseudolabrys sp.]|nr:DUF5330 domain-containing protein [Pseudolabrys sp.]